MKLLTFSIAEKEYAVEIVQVREVIRMRAVTPIPEAADFIEGIISLRGKVIPLINLRKKLGLPSIGLNRGNRIIITNIENHSLGIIVDKVSDVISVEPATIEAADEILKEANYLIGVCKIASRLILISDLHKLLSIEDKTNIQEVHNKIEIRKKL